MNEKNRKTPRRKIASALKYDMNEDNAPHVVAMGQGYVAEKIVEQGKKSGVAVVEDKPLADMLQNLSVGDEIPEELYHAVAEILVFIGDLDREYTNAKQRYTIS